MLDALAGRFSQREVAAGTVLGTIADGGSFGELIAGDDATWSFAAMAATAATVLALRTSSSPA